MKRDSTKLLKEVDQTRKMKVKCSPSWQKLGCTLKPETNLALMLCLVFYLYICLGGALFLLMEGQSDTPNKTKAELKELAKSLGISLNDQRVKEITKFCDRMNFMERRKGPQRENLWNFLEATDFAYLVVTGQGTGQTTRILRTQGGKIAYVMFLLIGVPLTVLTLRATGQRLNILTYSMITFINAKICNRQLTSNIHLKALLFNIFLFLFLLCMGTIMYCFTQNWNVLDSLVYTLSTVFTISNSQEKIVNRDIMMNSTKDKIARILFNIFTFISYTTLASTAWSAHHFTRHMRFKAQNQQLAKNGNQCPWVEVTRSHTASPSKSTRERETDRESVC